MPTYRAIPSAWALNDLARPRSSTTNTFAGNPGVRCIPSLPVAQSMRLVERAPTRPRQPTCHNAGGAELKVPPLSRHALAGHPPFRLGHVRLRIPIYQARREPILRRALLHGLDLLDGIVCRRRAGKLGHRSRIGKSAKKEQANDVLRAH